MGRTDRGVALVGEMRPTLLSRGAPGWVASTAALMPGWVLLATDAPPRGPPEWMSSGATVEKGAGMSSKSRCLCLLCPCL